VIPKETIDKIVDTARIDEVIGDFIALKRRGVNMIGLCPFHGEKTPSFTVSPAKGIYKCFGCGKGGASVNFIMDHEQLTYPDALKWLAKKYNIEIKEEELSKEQIAENNDRESILQTLSFAQKTFTDTLLTTDEGKTIGLSYFEERGFTNQIIEKFQLGYSPEQANYLEDKLLKNDFKLEYAERAGLIMKRENATSYYQRFTGRVIFPIHNVAGRVIGFGGRTLKKEKNVAKYVNSPQTEVYNKSEVLYGLYFAKKEIIAKDNCLLVEGYADVISMFQAGFENVVASSGTSLTVEQIRLIRRFTKNVTILYDGDAAGIKASFRGINLILEEGLNVRVLLFPDGEDPDSYSRKLSNTELQKYIEENTKDFISFKTKLLIDETKNDPVKRASLIKDIVESIALIPDPVIRSVYVQECGRIMRIDEQTLHSEVNKLRRKSKEKEAEKGDSSIGGNYQYNVVEAGAGEQVSLPKINDNIDDLINDMSFQEKDIIRILMLYGTNEIAANVEVEGENTEHLFKVSQVVEHELLSDQFTFSNALYQSIFAEIIEESQTDNFLDIKHFVNHSNEEIRKLAIDFYESPYKLHNWERQHINIVTEDLLVKQALYGSIYSLRLKLMERMKREIQEELKKEMEDLQLEELLEQIKQLDSGRRHVAFTSLGRVIVR
jgi:DNA primase